MSELVIHEGAIRKFFTNSAGPVGTLVATKAQEIEAFALGGLAERNYRTGDAIALMHVTNPRHDEDSLSVLVGTDAAHEWTGHEDFNYPIALELGGVTPSGVFYRYPFLGPAVEAAGFRKGG